MKFELDKNCKLEICDRIEKVSIVNIKLIEEHEIETFVTNINRRETLKAKITNANENISSLFST